MHLTDRMPDVLHGRDAWTEADHAHLGSCADCAGEWRVVRAVRIPSVEPLDTDALAAGVLQRLRESPVVLPLMRRRGVRLGLVGLAAAASIAVALLIRHEPPTSTTAFVPSREATMLPELDALLDAELEQVLATVSEDGDDPLGALPRLGDLTDEELETLLKEVEG